MWALNMAHRAHFIWGSDIVFTFGPLGYLAMPAFPEAGWVAVRNYEIFRYVLIVASLVLIQRRVRPYWVGLVGIGMFGLVAVLQSAFRPEQLEFAALGFALAVYAGLPKIRFWEAPFLGFLSAFCGFTKLNIGVEIAVLFLAYLSVIFFDPRQNHQRPKRITLSALGVAAVSAIVIFWQSGGSISKLLAYLIYAIPVLSGYSEAMAVSGDLVNIYSALLIMLLVAAVVLFSRCKEPYILVIIPAVALCFFFFKKGAVREPAGVLLMRLIIPIVLLMIVSKTRRDRVLFTLLGICSLLFGTYLFKQALPGFIQFGKDQLMQKNRAALVLSMVRYRQVARSIEAAYPAALQSRLLDSEIKAEISNHSVDVVPQYQDYVRANRLKWNPRPVFQSYATYAPSLDHLNSLHIQRSGAAEKIILGWETVDYRCRLGDDPLTTLSVINWYDLQARRPNFRLLTRRPTPRFSSEAPAGQTIVTWGKSFEIPKTRDDELLLMKTEVTRSFCGKILDLSFRLNPVFLDGFLRSGARVRGRLVQANLGEGIIISDWPRILAEADVFWDKRAMAQADRVSRICFQTASPWQYKPSIRIQWYRLKRSD
jgi:hypothetical protein